MARNERAQYRKTQAMIEQTHGGNAGRSLIEMLRDQLAITADHYVELDGFGPDDPGTTTYPKRHTVRGELRGLARAVCIIESPYAPTRGIKELEREVVQRAREARDG